MSHLTPPDAHSQSEADVAAAMQARTITPQDKRALLALAAFFALMLIGSWQRWTQPLIDHGREMNLPARILAGEQLYLDVQFLYGPFAPYFNAFLYRLGGVHLTTLRASGMACAVLILLMIYWLARQLMDVSEAALTAGLVLVICSLKSTANYIQPYAYAALYGLVFALGSLVCTVRYLQAGRSRWILGAGACAGLALISKPEISAAAMSAAAVTLALGSLSARRLLWRDGALFALPLVVISAVAYGFVLSRVPWRVLLEDNHIFFTNLPPQLIYFNRSISGLAAWPKSFWFTATGLGVFAFWVGLSALLGALTFARRQPAWRGLAKRALGAMVLGLAWWRIVPAVFRVDSGATPLAAAPIVLPAVILTIGWRVWRAGGGEEKVSSEHRLLLVIAVFALVSIARAILNVRTFGPYAPFFLPTLILVCLYLLFRWCPALFAPPGVLRANVQRAAMCLIAILIVGMAINSTYLFRRRHTYEVSAPRGRFITRADIGQPLGAAIRFARERTSPEDYLLTLPEATSINFLAERRYPLREEIVLPGFLADEKEADAIERLKARRVPLVLVVNRSMPEFRDHSFGVDYNQELMRWITAHYHLAARFDSGHGGSAQLGDEPFFILAYERDP